MIFVKVSSGLAAGALPPPPPPLPHAASAPEATAATLRPTPTLISPRLLRKYSMIFESSLDALLHQQLHDVEKLACLPSHARSDTAARRDLDTPTELPTAAFPAPVALCLGTVNSASDHMTFVLTPLAESVRHHS